MIAGFEGCGDERGGTESLPVGSVNNESTDGVSTEHDDTFGFAELLEQ